jgi:hypothetical protein
MQRFLINTVNSALLILIFIALPAISHKQFWNWQISSAPTTQKLIFGGLILAIAANVLGATIFIPGPKAKALCAKWSFIFGGFLFVEYAFVRGWINFDWLKNSLLWLQNHL